MKDGFQATNHWLTILLTILLTTQHPLRNWLTPYWRVLKLWKHDVCWTWTMKADESLSATHWIAIIWKRDVRLHTFVDSIKYHSNIFQYFKINFKMFQRFASKCVKSRTGRTCSCVHSRPALISCDHVHVTQTFHFPRLRQPDGQQQRWDLLRAAKPAKLRGEALEKSQMDVISLGLIWSLCRYL